MLIAISSGYRSSLNNSPPKEKGDRRPESAEARNHIGKIKNFSVQK